MDQEKIGRFIADCRRIAGFTQAALGERLGITDRAVSKWETGKSMPDVSIMLELCGLLNINVNELLAGERIDMENYKEKAEERLLEFRLREELNAKIMLSLESVICVFSTVACFVMIFAACIAVENLWWRVSLIAIGAVIFIVGVICALKLEQTAGYYECPACHEKYVPSMRAVFLAPHIGRKRKMRCPFCGHVGYQKKALKK